ncbi:hypothetical protein MPSEU_000100400 [Mayamaea pseudoterrestris]|nr:hypothetical protein MPSEU_000100400 [Mayamaea pseudoterrestris]
MRLELRAFVLFCGLGLTGAFLSSSSTQTKNTAHARSHVQNAKSQQLLSFLDRLPELPNPFGAFRTADTIITAQSLNDDDEEFDPSPSGLFRQAKRIVSADMGIRSPGLLDERFQWFGPVVDEPLGKTDYLAAGRFFDLRSAFSDLDYRAHDFRLDEEDSATVRLTCRVTGTMRGELRLRGEVLPPTGKTMKCPPEAVTMTFDFSSGKVLKITSGFVLDRLVGNTAGTTGVIAAAMVGGKSVSEWELYPATTVLKRFFGRPVKQLPEPKTFLAPFPETVMVQLAKGILAANMASEDYSLLAKSFTYVTPTLGPVRRKNFLEKYAPIEFDGVDPSFSHFRVDPYNPNVVWVDVRPSAFRYKGAPQSMSFTFDNEGFCTRITSGAVIDPTIGNGGGLAGTEGYKYATGTATPAIVTRPLPRALGRVRRRLVGIFTGKSLDDYDVARGPQTSKLTADLASPFEKLSTLRANVAEPQVKMSEASSSPPKPVQKIKANPEQQPKGAETEQTLQTTSFLDKLPSLPKLELSSSSSSSSNLTRTSKINKQTSESKFSFLSGLKMPEPLLSMAKSNPGPKSPSKKAMSTTRPQTVAANAAAAAAAAAAEENRRESTATKTAAEKQQQIVERKRLEAQQRADTQRKIEETKRKQAEAKAKMSKQREETKLAADAARLKKEESRRKESLAKQQDEEQRKDLIAEQKEQTEAQRRALEKSQQELRAQQRSQELAKQAAAKQTRSKAAEHTKSASLSNKQEKLENKQKQTEAQILSKLSQVTSRATIGLFGFGALRADDDDENFSSTKQAPTKMKYKAPFGMPTLSKWRKNFDGSITGVISGSSNFGDGEKVTTSAIANGTIAAGEVVRTASGSKYFLA